MIPDDSASLQELDLRGLKCPMPVLLTRRALSKAMPGHRIVVHCTDPMAAVDVPYLLTQTGDVLERCERVGDVMKFHVRKC